jgi:hypothetical protein
MSSTPTPRLRLEQQGTGDNSGTWGSRLNTNTIALIDEAIAGVAAITISGNVTLTSSNFATDQARKKVLKLDGTPASNFNITIPSVEKNYLVHNNTGKTATITTGSGATAAIPTTAVKEVYCDGTNVYATSDGTAPTTTGELLIATTTIGAGVTTVDMTLPANYAYFRVALAGIKSSASATVLARLSTDGSTFIGSGLSYYDGFRAGNQSEISLGTCPGTAGSYGGTITVTDPRNAASFTILQGQTLSDGAMQTIGGVRRAAEADVAMRLFLSTGTFQGGTVYVFGSKYQ